MTLQDEAEAYSGNKTAEVFSGRTGHGQTPGVVYRQMFRRELMSLLRGAFLAGAAYQARGSESKGRRR